jgi:hypothetical protein
MNVRSSSKNVVLLREKCSALSRSKVLLRFASYHAIAKALTLLIAIGCLPILLFSLPSNNAAHTNAMAAPDGLRKRKDIREVEMSPEELKTLRHAFFMLKKAPKTCDDPDAQTEYDCWAAYHNNFELYGCRHGSDLFWPWHRYHLVEFEKALRSSDPTHPDRVSSVTLPYWNWSQPPSGKFFPKAVEQKELLPGEYYPEDCPDATQKCINPLWVDGRRDARECQAIKPDCIQESLQLPMWREFGGGERTGQMSDFELQAHNFMHSKYIDGLMANPTTATRDPIYWFFHAFIDNVWDQWQVRHQADPCAATAVPNPTRALQIGDWPPANVQFQTVLCTKELGYEYVPFGVVTIAALPSCPAPRAGCQMQTPETPITLNAPATINSTPNKAEFRLTGVTVPSDFSYDAWIFFHPASEPYQPDEKTFADKYIATYFVVWRHAHNTSHARHNNPADQLSTIDIDLDVTNKLPQLVAKKFVATIVFAPSNSKERTARLALHRDVDFKQASLILTSDNKSQTIPLTLRR